MDPISNMFTQLKNAGRAQQKEIFVNFSKMNLAILKILKNYGFINDYKEEKSENKKYPQIKVNLAYKNKNELRFNNIRRVSSPGRRVYVSANKINLNSRGKAAIMISTSQGVMSGVDAKKKGLGGELIGEVV